MNVQGMRTWEKGLDMARGPLLPERGEPPAELPPDDPETGIAIARDPMVKITKDSVSQAFY